MSRHLQCLRKSSLALLAIFLAGAACCSSRGQQAEPRRSNSATAPSFSSHWSFTGKQLLTIHGDAACLWDIDSGIQIRRFQSQGAFVAAVALSPDGKYVVTATARRTGLFTWGDSVRLWEVSTGREVRQFGEQWEGAQELGAKRPGEAAYALLFSPDGKRILTATESVTIWDVKTGRRLFVFPDLHQCTFGSPATLSVNFSPDSKRLVQLANGGSRVIVWNLVQGRQVCVMGEGIFSCTVSFSPDGKTVLTASHEPGLPGTARTWDARTGRLLRVVAGHTGRVFQALYTGDGRKILTASRDGFAKLWDASTGQELRRFQNGGPGPIDRVSLSRDGKRFISKWSLQRSDESTIMPIATLWDTESGREIAQLTNHVEGIVGFAPGDERFMVVKDGSPVALMDGATGKVIRRY